MTIFSVNIFLVPGTHCLAVQHATTRLAGPPSHAEAEGMLLRSLCFQGNIYSTDRYTWSQFNSHSNVLKAVCKFLHFDLLSMVDEM